MGALGFGASLGVRARRGGRGFDFAGSMPAGATLTRGGAAYRHDAGGVLVSEAANVARMDHDPVTRAFRGLLIEGAATNLLLASETFDSASWANGASTITPDAAVAPNGMASADRVVETIVNGQHRQSQAVATTAGQACTLSVHVKAQERSRLWVRLIGTTTFASASFNLAAKTLSLASGSAVLTDYGDGWSRVSVSGVADAGTTSVYLNLMDDGGASSYVGSVNAGLLLWGAQFEAGSRSSYIATTTAAASRAADALTLAWGVKGVADGVTTVRYTVDDGSTQDLVTTITGGSAAVPTTLARSRVRRVSVI